MKTDNNVQNNPALLPATKVPERNTAVIRYVNAGDELRARLAAMGIYVGMRIEVCKKMWRGPLLLGINGCRVMLGRGMAEKLMVEVCKA
ncbi:MAG: ferrous iron transport protein A [Lentisphaerae bacterium]|nr:ferrous iron transport protein A [Lentisphaerota bacterium]